MAAKGEGGHFDSTLCGLPAPLGDCPALQGCNSQVETYKEAVENVKEATKATLSERPGDEWPLCLCNEQNP
jgi:hypothetical protein